MDTPIFKQLASSLSAKLICTPILQTEVRADCILGDYRFEGFIPEGDPSGLDWSFHPLRVIDADDKLIGMLWDGDARSVEDEELDETTVGHIMDPIGPSNWLVLRLPFWISSPFSQAKLATLTMFSTATK